MIKRFPLDNHNPLTIAVSSPVIIPKKKQGKKMITAINSMDFIQYSLLFYF
ncbi:hypothetical protein NLX69_02320 [Rossellomorea sp. BNER]|nr:hypothetical protein [Rossellomorea sp. BNER]